jgi:hypothetical protein
VEIVLFMQKRGQSRGESDKNKSRKGRCKGKKAAITLYVIIALVIVAAGLLVYFLAPDIFKVGFSKQKGEQILTTQSENLRDTVTKCVSDTVKSCLFEIGRKGGYYYVSDLWFADYAGPKYFVVYADENGRLVNKLPSLNMILTKSLNDCMGARGWDDIDTCINYDKFERHFSIEKGKGKEAKRSIAVAAGDCNVYVGIDWPMSLSKFTLAGSVKKDINQKNATLPICLDEIWRVANDIVNMEIAGNEWVNAADKYILDHPQTLKLIDIQVQYYPTYKQPIFILVTRPTRPGEEAFPFYFGINKEKVMGV